jgi:hypothetical protein
VVDTVVADMVVGAVSDTAVSDAAGKAVPARVAEQAPPEPYVPSSGERVPAELRLVLAGYVGIAGGLFATTLACAAAAVLVFFDADIRSAVFVFDADIDADPDVIIDLMALVADADLGGDVVFQHCTLGAEQVTQHRTAHVPNVWVLLR